MTLDWLDFDCSEDTDEVATFDAMATVWPEQQPLVLAEVAAILNWARQHFGPERPMDEGGEWDVDLQAWCETQPARSLVVNIDAPGLLVSDDSTADERVRRTITISLSGSASFAAALRHQFNL